MNDSSSDAVRKKAALCLLRLFRKLPLDAGIITPDFWAPRLDTLLAHGCAVTPVSSVLYLFLRLHSDLSCCFPFGGEMEFLFWCLPSFLLVLPSLFGTTHNCIVLKGWKHLYKSWSQPATTSGSCALIHSRVVVQVCLVKPDIFKPESITNRTFFGRRVRARRLKQRSCKLEWI